MRIAMVSEHASPLATFGGADAGGQNVYVAELSSALARRGHDVTVYTRRDRPELLDRVRTSQGVEVAHITAGPPRRLPKDELLPYMPELARGILDDWARVRPDVVHAHFWMSGLAAIDAARAANARFARPRAAVVETFHALGTVKRRHQGADDTSPPEREWLEPWVGRSADAVLATCSDEVRELEAMGVPTDRIEVSPCGVDTRRLRPDGHAEPRGRRHRVGVIGRLVPRKGADLVVHALAELARRGRDDIELIIVGGAAGPDPLADPECARLAQVATTEQVADRVILRGAVAHEQLAPIMRSCEAIVCTPWYEPFGIVPLEAAACGVPVIAAAVGGLLDTVVDGVTGIHVPPRDPGAIANAIQTIVDDPALAARYGRAARERACRLYTWDRVADLAEQLYARLGTGAGMAASANAVGL